MLQCGKGRGGNFADTNKHTYRGNATLVRSQQLSIPGSPLPIPTAFTYPPCRRHHLPGNSCVSLLPSEGGRGEGGEGGGHETLRAPRSPSPSPPPPCNSPPMGSGCGRGGSKEGRNGCYGYPYQYGTHQPPKQVVRPKGKLFCISSLVGCFVIRLKYSFHITMYVFLVEIAYSNALAANQARMAFSSSSLQGGINGGWKRRGRRRREGGEEGGEGPNLRGGL